GAGQTATPLTVPPKSKIEAAAAMLISTTPWALIIGTLIPPYCLISDFNIRIDKFNDETAHPIRRSAIHLDARGGGGRQTRLHRAIHRPRRCPAADSVVTTEA